jgi:aconitate hydratase
MFIQPSFCASAKVVMGPNIKPLPTFAPMPQKVSGEVLLKVGDNISTDDILPGGSEIMALRSNIPEISKHTFTHIDGTFAARALQKGGGFIVGGENYGQGSSREHAALAPKFLGVQVILAKSFARIHMANLVNFGILPLTFVDKSAYEGVSLGDKLELDTDDLAEDLMVKNQTTGETLKVSLNLSSLEKSLIRAGGKLAAIKAKQSKE